MNDKQILENAPEGATVAAEGMPYLARNKDGNWMRYDPNGFVGAKWFQANDFKLSYCRSFRALSDIARIAELEAENERLRDERERLLSLIYNVAIGGICMDVHTEPEAMAQLAYIITGINAEQLREQAKGAI